MANHQDESDRGANPFAPSDAAVEPAKRKFEWTRRLIAKRGFAYIGSNAIFFLTFYFAADWAQHHYDFYGYDLPWATRTTLDVARNRTHTPFLLFPYCFAFLSLIAAAADSLSGHPNTKDKLTVLWHEFANLLLGCVWLVFVILCVIIFFPLVVGLFQP